MKFIDEKHRIFYKEKLEEMKTYYKVYSNHKAFIYVLGVCDDTRRNFNQIFDIKNNRIKVECLQAPWQTGSSMKVTRLSFNLFNDFVYEDDDSINNNVVSAKYSPSEIFCCGYLEYFIEGIRLRFSEYTKIQEGKK